MTARQRRSPAKNAQVATGDTRAVKLNLAIAGVGAKDEVVSLAARTADGLVAMGHADPVAYADDEPATESDATETGESGTGSDDDPAAGDSADE